jgi:hypothetical protein
MSACGGRHVGVRRAALCVYFLDANHYTTTYVLSVFGWRLQSMRRSVRSVEN